MIFGLRLLPMAGDLREIVHWSQLAEEAGFDQIWFPGDVFMEDIQALAVVVAEHTSEIQVGVMISPFGCDPSALTSYAATLDVLSNGRALVSVGCHSTEMCRWTGQDPSDVVERTRAIVELFRTLLRGEIASTNGPIFQWTDDCYLRFEPVRSQIPVYIAAADRAMLELSGEIGDGALPPLFPPESARITVPLIRQGAQAAGRDLRDLDIAGCLWTSIATTPTEAMGAMRPIVSYFGRFLADPALATVGLSSGDFDEIRALHDEMRTDEAAGRVTDDMLRLAIVGTPADVIVRIESLASLGVTQVNIGGPLGPDPAEAIALMGTAVIPHFR